MTTLVLLPGLDGTGVLLERFVSELPADLQVKVLGYPTQEPLDYPGLGERLAPQLPEGPLLLIGESFGGPLAVRLAAGVGPRLVGVVLVASFIRFPIPLPAAFASRFLPLVARVAPPPWAVRRWLLGPQAPEAQVAELRAAISSVSSAALAARGRAVLGVDERERLRACDAPLLYLEGRQDRLVPHRSRREIQELRPDLQVEGLPAPHLVLQTRPRAAAERIARFAREALAKA